MVLMEKHIFMILTRKHNFTTLRLMYFKCFDGKKIYLYSFVENQNFIVLTEKYTFTVST